MSLWEASLNWLRSFRALLPISTKVKCLSDAGFFVNVPDVSRARYIESYFKQIVDLHGSIRNLPSYCITKSPRHICLFFKQEMELSLIGLQNAGKTSLVNVVATGGYSEDMIPTKRTSLKDMKESCFVEQCRTNKRVGQTFMATREAIDVWSASARVCQPLIWTMTYDFFMKKELVEEA